MTSLCLLIVHYYRHVYHDIACSDRSWIQSVYVNSGCICHITRDQKHIPAAWGVGSSNVSLIGKPLGLGKKLNVACRFDKLEYIQCYSGQFRRQIQSLDERWDECWNVRKSSRLFNMSVSRVPHIPLSYITRCLWTRWIPVRFIDARFWNRTWNVIVRFPSLEFTAKCNVDEKLISDIHLFPANFTCQSRTWKLWCGITTAVRVVQFQGYTFFDEN
jgi:hypothetical protein